MTKNDAKHLHLRISLPGALLSCGWLLLAVGIYALIGVVTALAFPTQYKSETPSTAAAIIAVAGLLMSLSRQISDKTEATSRFYLEEHRKGFDEAYVVLDSAIEGDPLLRVKWIAAARILATARSIGAKVTVAAHRDVMNMDIPRQSQRFLRFLERPPRYYYGVNAHWVRVSAIPEVDELESLHDAARTSTARRGDTINPLRYVDERVLQTVWSAIAYPAGYTDVLGDKFSDHDALFLPPGLRTYVMHRREYQSADGRLFQGEKEIPPP